MTDMQAIKPIDRLVWNNNLSVELSKQLIDGGCDANSTLVAGSTCNRCDCFVAYTRYLKLLEQPLRAKGWFSALMAGFEMESGPIFKFAIGLRLA